MFHMIVECCSADLLPINRSYFYQNMVRAYGEETARQFVYEAYFPPLEDED